MSPDIDIIRNNLLYLNHPAFENSNSRCPLSDAIEDFNFFARKFRQMVTGPKFLSKM